MELLKKLEQRETWLYATGIGIVIYGVVTGDSDIDKIYPHLAAAGPLLGVGGLAHVKRGQQRVEEVIATAKNVMEDRDPPVSEDEEEGPWD